MKKLMFLATVVAMSLAMAMPVQAQSRKDKKAAKKAQWEMEQKQKQEEAELRHQMKMDSLRAVQEDKERARAKAKADEEAAIEAAAKEKAKAEKRAQRKTGSEDMCTAYDDDQWFTASGSMLFTEEESDWTAMALLLSVQQQLLQKLRGKYKAVTADYFDMMHTEDVNYKRQHIEKAGIKVVEQMVNDTYETCRKTTDDPNENGQYTMYMSIKISKKEIIENVINEINNEKETQVRLNEQNFRNSFDKVFNEED